jgi:ketosteroid isomerase-like protein
MPEEKVEILRRVYAALSDRDWDAMFGYTQPDFEFVVPRGPAEGTHRGREDVERFLADFTDTWDEYAVVPEEFTEAGDRVVVLASQHAKPRGGSVDLVTHNGHLWTFRDGLIASMELFPDHEDALRSAGLKH